MHQFKSAEHNIHEAMRALSLAHHADGLEQAEQAARSYAIAKSHLQKVLSMPEISRAEDLE